nr:hypothetical protein [Tanacetum cinerariifolium]
MPSNKGVSTPKNPFPALLILAKTFWVRAGEVYVVVWVESAAGPSHTAVSPTYGQTSDIDASHLPDDPDMPGLEDIIYSDDEDIVGAEADFNNLESSIPVSPIPTTRIHKE